MNTTKDPFNHLDNQLPKSRFEFGKKLSLGFDIWKGGFGLLILFIIVYAILSSIISIVPYFGSIVNNLVVGPILMIGAYLFSQKIDFLGRAEFGDFFEGFKFASNVIIAQLIISVIYLLLAAPLLINFFQNVGYEDFMDIQQNPEELAYLFQDLFSSISIPLLIGTVLAYLVVGVLFAFPLHFIAFYGLDGIQALKYSLKYTSKHFIMLLIYFIVILILGMLGLVGLIFGVILTLPLIFTCSYSAFRHLTDLKGYLEEEAEDNVLDSLVDF